MKKRADTWVRPYGGNRRVHNAAWVAGAFKPRREDGEIPPLRLLRRLQSG